MTNQFTFPEYTSYKFLTQNKEDYQRFIFDIDNQLNKREVKNRDELMKNKSKYQTEIVAIDKQLVYYTGIESQFNIDGE